MGEDVVGTVAEEGLQVILDAGLALGGIGKGGFIGGDAVVGQANVGAGHLGAEEAHLADDFVTDGEGHVEMPSGDDEGVSEISELISEDAVDGEALSRGLAEDVVEHGVVAGMILDDAADGGDFVCMEDGSQVQLGVELGGEGRGEAHEFVGDDDGAVLGGSEDAKDGEARLGESDVLFIVPARFIARRWDTEGVEELELQFVDRLEGSAGDIDEDDFGALDDTGVRLAQDAAAVNDVHIEAALNLAEGFGKRMIETAIDGGIEHLAFGAEARVGVAIAGEERAEQDGAVDVLGVVVCGDEAFKDGADAAHFVNGFVGDVDECKHGLISGSLPVEIVSKSCGHFIVRRNAHFIDRGWRKRA